MSRRIRAASTRTRVRIRARSARPVHRPAHARVPVSPSAAPALTAQMGRLAFTLEDKFNASLPRLPVGGRRTSTARSCAGCARMHHGDLDVLSPRPRLGQGGGDQLFRRIYGGRTWLRRRTELICPCDAWPTTWCTHSERHSDKKPSAMPNEEVSSGPAGLTQRSLCSTPRVLAFRAARLVSRSSSISRSTSRSTTSHPLDRLEDGEGRKTFSFFRFRIRAHRVPRHPDAIQGDGRFSSTSTPSVHRLYADCEW